MRVRVLGVEGCGFFLAFDEIYKVRFFGSDEFVVDLNEIGGIIRLVEKLESGIESFQNSGEGD